MASSASKKQAYIFKNGVWVKAKCKILKQTDTTDALPSGTLVESGGSGVTTDSGAYFLVQGTFDEVNVDGLMFVTHKPYIFE